MVKRSGETEEEEKRKLEKARMEEEEEVKKLDEMIALREKEEEGRRLEEKEMGERKERENVEEGMKEEVKVDKENNPIPVTPVRKVLSRTSSFEVKVILFNCTFQCF